MPRDCPSCKGVTTFEDLNRGQSVINKAYGAYEGLERAHHSGPDLAAHVLRYGYRITIASPAVCQVLSGDGSGASSFASATG